MSNGTAIIEQPDHVAQAAMDELERMGATGWYTFMLRSLSVPSKALGPGRVFCGPDDSRKAFNSACDYLRYRGLLVEHGDGVVSIKERA